MFVTLGDDVPVAESDMVADEVWESLADAEIVTLCDCDSESVVAMEELALELALVNRLLDAAPEVLWRRVAVAQSVGERVEMTLLVSVPLLVSEGEPVEAPDRVVTNVAEASRDALVAREGVTLAVIGIAVDVVSTDPVAVEDALQHWLPEIDPDLLGRRVADAQCVCERVATILLVSRALLLTVAVMTALGVRTALALKDCDSAFEGVTENESGGECELDAVLPTEAVPASTTAVTETEAMDVGDALDVRERVEDAAAHELAESEARLLSDARKLRALVAVSALDAVRA